MIPPKPPSRPDKVSLLRYLRLFRQDILSAQPARLYRAWMAEFRTPFFRSYLINQPDLVKTVLKESPMAFPKSGRIAEGLRPLLGESVFLTNGAKWLRQRRIIDPAFEGGRLRETFPAMWQASQAARARLRSRAGDTVEIEEQTSHAAADIIFRTLFSIPIEDDLASRVFHEFRAYQRSQPIVNLAAFLPLPRFVPRFHRADTKASARRIRALITELTEARQREIASGTAPDDLATKIMTTRDPVTGETFTTDEMVDQVAIFFLAGHETSASALAWALYLLATHPEWQDKVAAEAQRLCESADFADMAKLRITRDVFRETLRLYPPVPMMVRETCGGQQFRGRKLPKGAQVVLSPWHQHRHERLWERPDEFDPARWGSENGKQCARDAYMPFSAGPRVCPGAGFAMVEGPLLLALLMRDLRFSPVSNRVPEPVAFLTVRARSGIHLKVALR
ncbi:cytochrome P450 [Salipiger sp. 1_MG-2023]|uniref:cytochrome P450 n=1 Tax=Salipiger sp. 1_MG-2023 TaxID=3062665 RepID=UPI0026E3EEDC|nr:cytochrome P450 [Salipiger sp. 1_MG-2023]MDO6584619.1 cytochrome P450 [Salipiger sp. 1_MG-2023]